MDWRIVQYNPLSLLPSERLHHILQEVGLQHFVGIAGTGGKASSHDPPYTSYKCGKYLVFDFPVRPGSIYPSLTSYPVVRRELRSYGYSYSLLNGELRSYHEFPNHILASVLASSLQSALRLSQIEMLSVWWKSRLNFLVAWTLSEYGGVMWIFSSCQYMFPLSHGQCKSDSGLVSCGLTLVASWTLCRHGACLSYVWMPRAVWAAMRLLLLAMLTANAKTGMGSSCGNFANVIIYVWSINFSMLVLPIEVNFASPELITLLYHHHCSLLSSHVLFFMVPGNGCKRLLPLAGETIGPYIVLLPTSCATNSLQGQIFTVGIPTCWSVVFWTAMAGKRFFTMFRQPSRHSLWNNWLMARLAHTGDTSLPWCEMKLQKCLGKKLVSRPTGLWTRSKHLMTGLLQWNNLCRFHLLYAVAMRFFTSPRSTSGFKSLVTCCAILEGSQATRRAAQA